MSNEQLIGDADLGPGAGERPGERPETAAVSRRPVALLDRSVVERLSRRTDRHGLAYFAAHYAAIGLGGWLCWATFPGPLFWFAFAFQALVTGFLLKQVGKDGLIRPSELRISYRLRARHVVNPLFLRRFRP